MAMDMRGYLRLRSSQMLQLERGLDYFTSTVIKESHNEQIAEIFKWHVKHLREQIANLEEITKELGGETGARESPLMKGISDNHQEVMEANSPPEIIDMHNIESALMISNMKIGLYSGLIDVAHLVGDRMVIEKLEHNQADEERMRSRVQHALRPLETKLSGEFLRKAA